MAGKVKNQTLNRPQEGIVGLTPPTPARNGKRRNRLKGVSYADYKNTELLGRFLNDQGKLLPRRITGTTATGQADVTKAVKRARYMALLPYVPDNLS
jgi:small subunit ribosomal protein S18